VTCYPSRPNLKSVNRYLEEISLKTVDPADKVSAIGESWVKAPEELDTLFARRLD
jgi:hypothetical protein